MGSIFRINPDSLSPSSDSRIISAPERAQWHSANEVLAAARRQADDMAEAAKQAYAAQYAKGYEDGQEACRGEYAEKVLEVAVQSLEYIEGLERTLVKVVTDAVARVIGELDDNERIVRVVRTALASVRSQKQVVMRVSPTEERAVSEGLAAMISNTPGASSFLTVVADPRLPLGSCILESELGVVDASLETQLRALEKALNAKITGA